MNVYVNIQLCACAGYKEGFEAEYMHAYERGVLAAVSMFSSLVGTGSSQGGCPPTSTSTVVTELNKKYNVPPLTHTPSSPMTDCGNNCACNHGGDEQADGRKTSGECCNGGGNRHCGGSGNCTQGTMAEIDDTGNYGGATSKIPSKDTAEASAKIWIKMPLQGNESRSRDPQVSLEGEVVHVAGNCSVDGTGSNLSDSLRTVLPQVRMVGVHSKATLGDSLRICPALVSLSTLKFVFSKVVTESKVSLLLSPF